MKQVGSKMTASTGFIRIHDRKQQREEEVKQFQPRMNSSRNTNLYSNAYERTVINKWNTVN